jgi:hypothetical protein
MLRKLAGLRRLVQCLSSDFTEVLFVQLRVISWIDSLSTAGDPINHTNNTKNKSVSFDFMKLADDS